MKKKKEVSSTFQNMTQHPGCMQIPKFSLSLAKKKKIKINARKPRLRFLNRLYKKRRAGDSAPCEKKKGTQKKYRGLRTKGEPM